MLPVLSVQADTITKAWEKSITSLYYLGENISTQYDKNENDYSLDCTMIITVDDPMKQPRIHRCLPVGFKHLEEYTNEVILGTKDDTIVNFKESVKTGKLYYTYHSRLNNYPSLIEIDGVLNEATKYFEYGRINQIKDICDKLVTTPYTRRAQAITWIPAYDNYTDDPPCLQSIWCRLIPNNDTQGYNLIMNVRMRSNDAYRAAFMNIYAFTALQYVMATYIEYKLNKPVNCGRYCHMADSYHIYSNCFEDIEKRFLPSLKNRTFEQRTMKNK